MLLQSNISPSYDQVSPLLQPSLFLRGLSQRQEMLYQLPTQRCIRRQKSTACIRCANARGRSMHTHATTISLMRTNIWHLNSRRNLPDTAAILSRLIWWEEQHLATGVEARIRGGDFTSRNFLIYGNFVFNLRSNLISVASR